MTISGHEAPKQLLANLLSSERTSSALLFSGPAGVGKALVAKEFAGSFLKDPKRCWEENHPDLRILRPLGKGALHTIESIRELAAEVALDPLEASHKVFILEEAHRMGMPAANALLKALEEPSSNTLMILITHKKERLLPTIASRCRMLSFGPLAQLPGYAEEVVSRAHGSMGVAKCLANGGLERRQTLLSLLDSLDHYPTIFTGLEKLSMSLEGAKKANQKALRTSFVLEDLPAVARAAKELEIEGRSQVMFLEEVEYLLEELLLANRYPEALKAAADAYEGIERFSKPSTCLETLLLRLAPCEPCQ